MWVILAHHIKRETALQKKAKALWCDKNYVLKELKEIIDNANYPDKDWVPQKDYKTKVLAIRELAKILWLGNMTNNIRAAWELSGVKKSAWGTNVNFNFTEFLNNN